MSAMRELTQAQEGMHMNFQLSIKSSIYSVVEITPVTGPRQQYKQYSHNAIRNLSTTQTQ
jgi:hypothetical protein